MGPKKKLKSMEGQTLLPFANLPTSSTCDQNNNSIKPSTIEKPKFQSKWLQTNHWLAYDQEKNVMYCKLCRDLKLKNSLALGTDNFKTTTITRHVDSGDHKHAISASISRDNFEAAVAAADSKEVLGLHVCLQVVFWMAKEAIPLSKYESLMNLLECLGTPNIKFLKVGKRIDYQSYNSACDFLEAISQSINERITVSLQNSPVITIMTDESTDIVVHHKLCISARIVDPITLSPKTMFLTDLRITSATGKGIFDAIKGHLSTRNINIKKITGK